RLFHVLLLKLPDSSRFRGKSFPALGELDVFAFAAAGFLADTLVDLDAVAAGRTERVGWTLEVGIAAPTVLDSRPARTPRTGHGSRPNGARLSSERLARGRRPRDPNSP